jgi:hypothetical protein
MNNEVKAMKKEIKKDDKAFIKTRVKHDNSIEVEIQKNPAKTVSGRILIILIVAGTALVPLAALIYALVTAFK